MSLSLVSLVVLCSVTFYFEKVIGYSASEFELILFVVIYAILSLFFILLLTSFSILNRKNTKALQKENLLKADLQRDFNQFKKGINPPLLFRSLESLLVMIKNEDPAADDLLDQLSVVYRYILSKRKVDLISINQELAITEQLILLFNHLPFTKIKFRSALDKETLIIPGSLLNIIELIIDKSIQSKNLEAEVHLTNDEHFLKLEFDTTERLNQSIVEQDLMQINESYQYFSDEIISIDHQNKKMIKIPILTETTNKMNTLHESTDH